MESSSSTRATPCRTQPAAEASAASRRHLNRAGRACACSTHCPMPACSTYRPPAPPQALAAAERAGGFKRRASHNTRGSTFGRGRAASFAAARHVTDRGRRVAVKARIVRHGRQRTPLRAHLEYLRREGVTKDSAPGRMFDAERDSSDHRAFAERCDGDRHHFRFIVSPEDADQLSDLKAYTRDLMVQAERDLGTKLDRIGAEH